MLVIDDGIREGGSEDESSHDEGLIFWPRGIALSRESDSS